MRAEPKGAATKSKYVTKKVKQRKKQTAPQQTAKAATEATIESATPPNAGVVKRLGAMVYDFLLLFAILLVGTAIPSLIFSDMPLTATPGDGEVVTDIQQTISSNILTVYLCTLIFLFYGWFWRRSGQTLGMQVWHLKVVSKDGNKPSWGQCILRCLVGLISIAAGGMGYWWVWLDKDNRSWHDIASSTKVLQLPKPPKKKK